MSVFGECGDSEFSDSAYFELSAIVSLDAYPSVLSFGAETSILEEGLKNEQPEVNGREKQVMIPKKTYFFTKLPPRFLFIE